MTKRFSGGTEEKRAETKNKSLEKVCVTLPRDKPAIVLTFLDAEVLAHISTQRDREGQEPIVEN